MVDVNIELFQPQFACEKLKQWGGCIVYIPHLSIDLSGITKRIVIIGPQKHFGRELQERTPTDPNFYTLLVTP